MCLQQAERGSWQLPPSLFLQVSATLLVGVCNGNIVPESCIDVMGDLAAGLAAVRSSAAGLATQLPTMCRPLWHAKLLPLMDALCHSVTWHALAGPAADDEPGLASASPFGVVRGIVQEAMKGSIFPLLNEAAVQQREVLQLADIFRVLLDMGELMAAAHWC